MWHFVVFVSMLTNIQVGGQRERKVSEKNDLMFKRGNNFNFIDQKGVIRTGSLGDLLLHLKIKQLVEDL